jgi:lipopolysaccharide export system protein LptA
VAESGRVLSNVAVLAAIAATGAAIFFAKKVFAQQLLQGSNLRLAEYYPAPRNAQMKSFVQGQHARPATNGTTLVNGAKLETFQESGQKELVAEAPECILDQAHHTLDSPGPLELNTADAKFHLDGVGFLWQQTNSVLFISNKVHTIIQPELLATNGVVSTEPEASAAESGSRNKTKPIEIFSDRFRYSKETGLAIYTEHVHATGTNMDMTSRVLTLVLPMSVHELKTVTADEDVVMNYEAVHATGDHATYDVATEIAHVTGRPAWQSEGREGSGDDLLIDRTNKIFTTTGNGFLKLPAQNMASSLFAGTTNDPAQAANSNVFVEIRSPQYVFYTNTGVFYEGVRVAQLEDNAQRGGMTCQRLTVNFQGTNQLESLLAQTNVVIDQVAATETNRFLAAQAFYTASNSIMKLTGDPRWSAGLREGKGDVVFVNVTNRAMDAVGNAWMRLPASELGATVLAGGSTNSAHAQATTNAPEFADIYCHDYTVSPETAVFRGDVHVVHPRMDWVSKEITVTSTPGANQKKISMVANGDVAFDLTNESGEKMHGVCETAFYDYVASDQGTNDVFRLTGNPILTTTNGTLTNSVILLDHARNKLIAPGRYAISGSSSSIGTNGVPKL